MVRGEGGEEASEASEAKEYHMVFRTQGKVSEKKGLLRVRYPITPRAIGTDPGGMDGWTDGSSICLSVPGTLDCLIRIRTHKRTQAHTGTNLATCIRDCKCRIAGGNPFSLLTALSPKRVTSPYPDGWPLDGEERKEQKKKGSRVGRARPNSLTVIGTEYEVNGGIVMGV